MKVLAKDSNVLRSISPSTIANYLMLHGWRQVSFNTNNEYSFWIKDSDGPRQIAILLPMDHAQLDYSLRIAELLQRLATLEQRSKVEIVDEWLGVDKSAKQ